MSNAEPAFPGFDSPGVGFGQPFEMLEACHERVQRTLTLLGKLVDHVEHKGHDEQTRSAAADVLRYFDIAAPLHHEDEEVNVFPLLLAEGDAPLRAAVQRLQGEHQRMGELWAAVREPLLRWREPGATESVDDATRSAVKSFRDIYDGHIATEEGLVFLAARTLMDDAALAHMGQAMQARRQSA
jgi:hemerythrin-like domain-containing protein